MSSKLVVPDEMFSREGYVGLTTAEERELADWRAFFAACSTRYGTERRPFGAREYVALYAAQGGRCYICQRARGRNPSEPLAYAGRKQRPRRLGVDHNHLTGLVRGLLCTGSLSANTCNRLIAKYTVDQLMRAVSYMQYPPAIDVLADLYGKGSSS